MSSTAIITSIIRAGSARRSSEGLTVITHQGNAAFFEEIVKRPHTRVPDALAKNPKPLKIETVADEKVITDGTMTVHLYSAPSEHSETMLMAYLPRDRALVVIDVYEPVGRSTCSLRGLIEDLKKRNLRVERIVPLHGKIVSYEQMVKDAGRRRRASHVALALGQLRSQRCWPDFWR